MHKRPSSEKTIERRPSTLIFLLSPDFNFMPHPQFSFLNDYISIAGPGGGIFGGGTAGVYALLSGICERNSHALTRKIIKSTSAAIPVKNPVTMLQQLQMQYASAME